MSHAGTVCPSMYLRSYFVSEYNWNPVVSARTGSKQWEMDLDGALLSAPVIAGDWLVFGTDANVFYVLEELY